MTGHIVADDRTVAELLAPNKRFTTPSYQRPYAWTTEEIGRLFADLRHHQTIGGRNGEDPGPYFLGSMVFVDPPAAQARRIVDGLQRLMSLTILLAVLRDLDPVASGLAAGHVLARRRFGGAVEPLVRPRRSGDAAFFYDNIQRPGATQNLAETIAPETDAQARMLENALWLRAALSDVSQRELRWLAEFILRGCVLIEVTAPNEDLAHKVFQVMNDRGLDLRVNDVLKSDVVGALPEAEREPAATRWEDLEADLGVDAFTQLFGHIRKLHRPEKAQRAILTELREILRPDERPSEFLSTELIPRGRALHAIRTATIPLAAHAERVNRLVRGLRRLPNSDWETLAVGFLADRRPRGDEALVFMTELDRLAYAMALASADENTRLKRFAKPINALRDGATIAELCAILDLTDNEKKTARSVLNGPFYTKERIRLPVLLRIDEQLADSGAWYDAKIITVEHILPRNPPEGSPWLEAFPNADERRKLTDRIGNLTLLSRHKNIACANYPFVRKTLEYFAVGATTPFALTTRLITKTEWNAEALKQRQQELVDVACRMWRL
ncbi:MAG: DUF262 domain-containing HNH endonuclease family protein [Pseudomonadota bacterium]